MPNMDYNEEAGAYEIMKKRRTLAVMLILSEALLLFLLHRNSVVSRLVSYRRYAFMYFMLGIIFGRFKCGTNLFWDEAKRIILSNITFFLATNVMNSLRMWTVPYILWNALTTIVMTFMAAVFNRYYRIWFRKWVAQNVVIIGAGSNAYELEVVYRCNRFAISNVVAVVDCNSSERLKGVHQDIEEFQSPIIQYDDLVDFIKSHDVDEIVIALPDASREQMQVIYSDVNEHVNVVKSMPKVNGMVTYQSQVEDFDGLILISSSTGLMHQDVFGLIVKRFFDILGGIAGVILLIPITIYIKIQFLKSGDKESIFFAQERIGRKGKLFKIYKYRSMVPNAEAVLEKLMQENPEIREEYETNKKLENDPRVTPIGAKIRKASIDELPQLINVLKGDMSLVGPRPYLPREKEDMGKYYKTIIQCKPGLTGMWQTHGRSEAPFPQRLKYDDYYYRNWSIWLDLTILYKTFRTVNSTSGAL